MLLISNSLCCAPEQAIIETSLSSVELSINNSAPRQSIGSNLNIWHASCTVVYDTQHGMMEGVCGQLRGRLIKVTILMAILMAVALLETAVSANVGLEWRPGDTSVQVGDGLVLGLYAVSDNGADQPISAMDVVVLWDPSFLRFDYLGEPQPVWLGDGFYTPSDWPDPLPDPVPDNIKNDINYDIYDGNALYSAMSQFGASANATPGGLLCVDFYFTALAPTNSTSVSVAESYGNGITSVFDGTQPNTVINGALGSAQISVTAVPEPASVAGLLSGLACFIGLRRRMS